MVCAEKNLVNQILRQNAAVFLFQKNDKTTNWIRTTVGTSYSLLLQLDEQNLSTLFTVRLLLVAPKTEATRGWPSI